MPIICERTNDRIGFVRKVMEQEVLPLLKGNSSVLVKTNHVNSEPYPTTTHPETLDVCLSYLKSLGLKVIVGDGPAWDMYKCTPSGNIVEGHPFHNHPLMVVCQNHGVDYIDLSFTPSLYRTGRGGNRFFLTDMIECGFCLSLPVLKSHISFGLTGALKGQIGLLSYDDKKTLHKDVDRERPHTLEDNIASEGERFVNISTIKRANYYIIDAIETMTNAQQARWGGVKTPLGYMLAGTDPLGLDIKGFELLKAVETKLDGKNPEDILYLRFAMQLRMQGFL